MNKSNRITALLMLLTLFGRATGLLREIMLSYIYGASAMSDAYVIATTFSSVFFAGIAAAVLNGYIPVAVEEDEKGRLNQYTRDMMLITSVGTYLFSLIIVILLNPILLLMAKGFSADAFGYAHRLSIYILAFSPILCIINVLIGYLQIKGIFLISALQSVVTNIIMVVVFYVTLNDVNRMGIGYGLSVGVPFLVILFVSSRYGFCNLKGSVYKGKSICRTWKLIIPTLGVQLAAQVNSVIDRAFASTLEEGAVSSLKYAFLICTMVVSIIAVSIGTVKYPKLALAYGEKRESLAVDIFSQMMNGMMLCVIPIIFGVLFLAHPIIKILFEHGAFLEADTVRTAVLLQIYAFSILGNSFQEIISRILLAAKKARALFVLYTGYVLLNILFNSCFVKCLGARGLALGTTLSTLLSVIAMLWYLKREYRSFKYAKIGKTFGKVLIASLGMTSGLMLVKALMYNVPQTGFWTLLQVSISVILGAVVYFVILAGLKEEHVLEMFMRVKSSKGGKISDN